jgi:hypothetical protein
MDRERGMAEHFPSGFPPPLAPPRKGEGNAVAIRRSVMLKRL